MRGLMMHLSGGAFLVPDAGPGVGKYISRVHTWRDGWSEGRRGEGGRGEGRGERGGPFARAQAVAIRVPSNWCYCYVIPNHLGSRGLGNKVSSIRETEIVPRTIDSLVTTVSGAKGMYRKKERRKKRNF